MVGCQLSADAEATTTAAGDDQRTNGAMGSDDDRADHAVCLVGDARSRRRSGRPTAGKPCFIIQVETPEQQLQAEQEGSPLASTAEVRQTRPQKHLWASSRR